MIPKRQATLVTLSFALALAFTACSDGGGSSRRKGGKVTPLATPCPSGAGTLPNTTCQVLRVASRGNDDVNVELRVTEPDPLALPLGTVLLSSGGDGSGFYSDQPGGDLLVGALSDAGWRVVDRQWEQGWFTTDTSVLNQSRRYAVLLEWVDKNLHQEGDLVASGAAEGAGEIAYALTQWKQGKLLDTAVLTSGPALTRLDYLCGSPPPVDWAAQCAALVPAGALDCGTPACSRPNAPACAFLDPAATPEELAEDSILSSGAATDFGDTHVHIAIGSDNCDSSVVQALLFKSAIASRSSIEFVSGTAHQLTSTQAGRDAIVAALVNASLPEPAIPPPTVRQRVTILKDSGDVTVIERSNR